MKLLLPTYNNLLTQGAPNFFKSQNLFHQFSLLSENISYNVSTENAVFNQIMSPAWYFPLFSTTDF